MQIWRLLFQTIFHFWNLFCYHHFNFSNAIRNLFPNSWAHLLLKNKIVYGFSFFFFPPETQTSCRLPFVSLPSLPPRLKSQSLGSWQESAAVFFFFFLLCELLEAGCRGVNGNWVSMPACTVCATKSICYEVPRWISGATFIHAWWSTSYFCFVLVLARFDLLSLPVLCNIGSLSWRLFLDTFWYLRCTDLSNLCYCSHTCIIFLWLQVFTAIQIILNMFFPF